MLSLSIGKNTFGAEYLLGPVGLIVRRGVFSNARVGLARARGLTQTARLVKVNDGHNVLQADLECFAK